MKNKPQNKYKLTPDVFKTLTLTADVLPKFQRKDKNGNLMWATKTEFKGTENFNAEKGTYTKLTDQLKVPLLVNHHVNLREIYQKDGNRGVQLYVKFFTDEMEKARLEAEENKLKKDLVDKV